MPNKRLLESLDDELVSWPGTVSVWIGPTAAGAPATYERDADAIHYAASTMKIAVLAALYESSDDLDAEIPVVNDFVSAKPGAPRFAIDRDDDSEVWDRLGDSATLRWLARRMIVRSSNLATNLLLSRVGIDAVREILRRAGAARMTVNRGIEDVAARDAGLDNVITARDLAGLMATIDTWPPETLDVLLAQEDRDDLARGLPPGTPIAHKSGWTSRVRHSAGIVFPDDAPPYVIVVAITGFESDRDACTLIALVSATSWENRHEIG
jgi:beta-lactamase class A